MSCSTTDTVLLVTTRACIVVNARYVLGVFVTVWCLTSEEFIIIYNTIKYRISVPGSLSEMFKVFWYQLQHTTTFGHTVKSWGPHFWIVLILNICNSGHSISMCSIVLGAL